MNKILRSFANKQRLPEFSNKLLLKWRERTIPGTPLDSTSTASKTTEDILRDLVAIPAVTGNYEANHEIIGYVETYLKERRLYIKHYQWNGVESLVATTQETKTPTVLLFGHVDVVDAKPEFFQLTQKDGRYYGRGVLDMKGGIAAFLGAIDELRADIKTLDFGVMITSDEEIGGYDGAARLAEAGYRPKIIILPDGGSNWNLEKTAKGIWHITIEASGKSAHGSRPWEGENAVDKLVDSIAKIKLLFPEASPTSNTINIGMIHGGHAINQIPNSAGASIDMRFVSSKDQTRITGKIADIVKNDGLVLTTEVEAEPMINHPSDPYLKQYAKCTEEVIGRPVEWITSNAGNDGRFFTPLGVPCAITYPPGGNHHGNEEYVEIAALSQLQTIIRTYLTQVARI